MTTTPGTAVAKITPVEEIRKSLSLMQEQFKMALPPQVSPEKFIRVTMTAIQQNPKLSIVTRQSLYAAAMRCAQDGLLPDGREAAFVIFGEDATYMPMVAGILKKVRNSGELASITSQVVHKSDVFRFWIDSEGEHLNHEPLMFGDRGEAIGVYALAKTKDGAIYIEVMDKAQVLAVKAIAKTKTVWDGAFAHEMWRKSAIRRLSKRLPMSTDLEQVITRDDQFYELNPETKPAKEAGKPNRLRSAIASTEAPAPAEGQVVKAEEEI